MATESLRNFWFEKSDSSKQQAGLRVKLNYKNVGSVFQPVECTLYVHCSDKTPRLFPNKHSHVEICGWPRTVRSKIARMGPSVLLAEVP